tara:strand:+ start:132 stop:440 length:309 start_codon:yes stop_codon:yes gene_type:complete
MKQTFRLTAPGKDDARVRDKIRHEINKYVKRERRKDVPDGYFRWDMDCQAGDDESTAVEVPLKELSLKIDEIAAAGAEKVYVQIVAKAIKRSPKPQKVPKVD